MNKHPCTPQVGADVEGFLYNPDKGVYVPCVGLLPGTKEEPHQLPDMPKGFCVQEDNVMVEFNIPPAKTWKAFDQHVKYVIKSIRNILPKGHEVHYKAAVKFKLADLTSEQAQTIGCDPDFDAYAGGEIRAECPTPTLWRGAGGHIHLGGDFQCPDFVAALFADVCIGVQNGIVGGKPSDRDKWYGQPGIFRPKPYGIEWRSPSGEWAGMSDYYQYIGGSAMHLVRWLTTSDAKTLQAAFRDIDWTRIHNYLTFGKVQHDRSTERQIIIDQARKAGAPI